MIPHGHNQTTRKGCHLVSDDLVDVNESMQCMVIADLQAGNRTSE